LAGALRTRRQKGQMQEEEIEIEISQQTRYIKMPVKTSVREQPKLSLCRF
jgi:ATP-dependent protease HslVU (ClpYQ) ATPase subunit